MKNSTVEISTQQYVSKLGELLSQTFIPIYRNVTAKFWSVKPFSHQDWDGGLFVYALPTVPNPERNVLHGHLIVVKVHDHPVDREIFEEDVENLVGEVGGIVGQIPLLINAYSFFHVYKSFRETHICRLKKFGRKAWLKCRRLVPPNDQKVKAMSFPIVSRDPDKTVKTILTLIVNFWRKAVYSLAEKLRVDRWQYNDSMLKLYSLLLYNIIVIKDVVGKITRYYCMVVDWLEEKLRTVIKVLGGKQVLARVLKRLNPKANCERVLEAGREASIKILIYSVSDRAERRIMDEDEGRAEKYLEFLKFNAVREELGNAG